MADPVTFDGELKQIHVDAGVRELEVRRDLYSAWKRWVHGGDGSQYPEAMRSFGNIDVGGGKSLGNTFLMVNGWLVVPENLDHRLVVNGNLFGDAGADLVLPVAGPATVTVEVERSIEAQSLTLEQVLTMLNRIYAVSVIGI